MSRLHKAVVSFPTTKTEQKPPPAPENDGQDYLDHLLALADQFIRAHAESPEELDFRDKNSQAA